MNQCVTEELPEKKIKREIDIRMGALSPKTNVCPHTEILPLIHTWKKHCQLFGKT